MKSCKAASICIIMLNSPNIPLYAHKATIVNYIYAARHGYNFIVERCPRPEDLDKSWMWDNKQEYLFVWSKPTLVRKHLPFYDYVLFIDSDAIVIDQKRTIEDFIKQHMNDDTCIVAAQDCQKSNKCWVAENLNTGVMLFKRSPMTLRLLDDWFKATDDLCRHTLYEHPREQECLNLLRRSGKYKDLIKILPVTEMGGHDGLWIQHYAAMKRDMRESIMTKNLDIEIKSFMQTSPTSMIEGFSAPSCKLQDTNPVELFIISGVFLIICFILASILYPRQR